ncbi:hypothetical protein GCM10027048_38790 [Hymenobacter coalescens]
MKAPSRLLFALFLLLTPALARAQTRNSGYWNLETNLITRDFTVVRFYNAQDQLVYEERLSRLCLDLSRGSGVSRRAVRQLNTALHQVLLNPQQAAQTTAWLDQTLGQNRRLQRTYAVR